MKRMMIGALAVATGVKITTIRYYERAGLMPMPTRTAGQHRNYAEDHLLRLIFICRARELGFSIDDIRKLLALADPARQSCREVEHLAAAHLEKLRKKIAALVNLEAMLSHAVSQCGRKADLSCPVLTLLGDADGKSRSVADPIRIGRRLDPPAQPFQQHLPPFGRSLQTRRRGQ